MPKRGFDFFLIYQQVNNLIKAIQENNTYLMGLILWLGFNPAVVYYHRTRREKRYGRSMWTFAKKIKYFVDSFVAFSYAPLRATSFIGICLSFFGLLYALIVILRRLMLGVEVEGWSSLIVVLLLVTGVQMLRIGGLAEYLWRNLDETRHRPRFIVDEIYQPGTDSEVPEAMAKARGEE